MENILTPKLKSYKEEFDFLHKKIGELEWEISIIDYGEEEVLESEFNILQDQLESYGYSIGILVAKIKNEVIKANKNKLI